MKKLTYNYVKQKIEKEEYKLLSEKYKNSRTKLKIQCPIEHQYNVTYSHFQQGIRCPICYGNKKLTYNFVKSQFEKQGYKLLSKEYKNTLTKLLIQCPIEHQYNVTYGDFQQGIRCPECFGTPKHSFKYIKQQFEKEGYKLLSEKYQNVHNKLKIECPEKHQYNVTYSNFQQGQRCPICWELKTYSRSEKDCLNIIKQLTNENIIENDRTQIINPKTGYNLELDIYIPSLNKAIEFNGEYWHMSDYSKYKDKQKIEQCKEMGINLIIIKETDWINNKEECYNIIKEFIR